jgi:Ca2+-binding EF-hand superfamily protein
MPPLSIDTAAGAAGDGDAPVPEPELEMGVLEDGFFAAADSDNDGYVSKSEFVAYCYKSKGASPDADDWKNFYSADANADGRISREEFDKYVAARWSAGTPRLTLDTINVEPDDDAPVPEPACELGMLEVGFFDAADTDGDGFVSKAEFAAYRLKQCGQAPSPDDWKAFYAADGNGDARISRAEFESFVASQWGGVKVRHDVDDRVVVHSLQSATEHNGKSGVVVAFNPGNGRYAVRMDDGSALSVRPGNLATEGSHETGTSSGALPDAAPSDIAGTEADPELERARAELTRLAEERKKDAAEAQAASAAAQVCVHHATNSARGLCTVRTKL